MPGAWQLYSRVEPFYEPEAQGSVGVGDDPNRDQDSMKEENGGQAGIE